MTSITTVNLKSNLTGFNAEILREELLSIIDKLGAAVQRADVISQVVI